MTSENYIKQTDIDSLNVKSAPNKLEGNARDNKKIFDKLPEFIAQKHNGLVEFVEDKIYTKLETEAALNERVFETGAADMCKLVYDPDGTGRVLEAKNAVSFGGQTPEYYGKDAETTHTYTHTKESKAHELTGEGSNGKFKAAYSFDVGDTFSINGTVYPCYSGEDLTDELIVGRWYSFIFDGTQINFKSGGGANFKVITVATEADLPVAAKTDSFAMVSDVAANKTYIQNTAPQSPQVGDVWCKYTQEVNDKTAYVAKNICMTITQAYQFVSNTWMQKSLFVYKGRWQNTNEVIFYNKGNECAENAGLWMRSGLTTETGGYTVTYPEFLSDKMRIYVAPNIRVFKGTQKTDKYDFSKIKTLKITINITSMHSNGYFHMGIATTRQVTSMPIWVGTKKPGVQTLSLDISNFTQMGYVDIAAYSADFEFEATVEKIWGEYK